MGMLINKKAAVTDIVADCRSTLTAAKARGGQLETLAKQYLSGPLGIFDLVMQRLQAVDAQLAPLQALKDAKDEASDALIGRISDEIWNDIGRPAHDPAFALLFPDGVSFYTDSPDAEQPIRMELLAELLEAGLHPKLDSKKATDHGKQLRDSAKTLRDAVEKTLTPRAQHLMLSKAKTALGRNLQMALVTLKRHLKATGTPDPQIHSIIPDRTRSTPRTAPSPAPLAPTASPQP
jgi:hypothetical protein